MPKTTAGRMAAQALTALSRRRLPQTSGELKLADLTAPVEIIRDRWGVPHIYADNRQDLFFAQGFVHAQDRLWQMELNRRTAQGRLSEIFGEVTLETDRVCRIFGFDHLGHGDLATADETIHRMLNAYAAGINAWLGHPKRKLPIEFSLVRHKPARWQPADSAAFSRLMLWQLSHAWQGELIRAKVIEKVGAEAAAELDLHGDQRVALPEGIEFNRLNPDGAFSAVPGPFLNRALGSNAWAVSGQKTDTGTPHLGNDMHLPVTMPSLWYENHLCVGDDYHVAGVTPPGLPMVLAGHNQHIAWGITLAFTDGEDLFVEQLDPARPSHYRFADEWRPITHRVETIRIKGQPDHQETVRSTHHGPIIGEVLGEREKTLTVSSMALRPTQVFDGWLKLTTAANWDDFLLATREMNANQINVTYADTAGNIGYRMVGELPQRAAGDGTTPTAGWQADNEWQGAIPFEAMPYALNPARGFVANANNKIVDDDYPHFLGHAWMNGYRAQKIAQRLSRRAAVGFDDYQNLMTNVDSLPGRALVRHLIDWESDDPDVQLALRYLASWGGRLTAESVGGAIYQVTRYYLAQHLLAPHLGEALTRQVLGEGFHPILMNANEWYGHDTEAILAMLDNPKSWWVAQAGGKTNLLNRSMKAAILWLRDNHGPKPTSWNWGKLHQLTINHALGVQKPLDEVFSRGPYPVGGDTDTVFQSAFHPSEHGYHQIAWAPSYRQLIDLGDFSRTQTIMPGGASGQLGSPHYDDQIPMWLQGEFKPFPWFRPDVMKLAVSTLSLHPSVA